MSTDTIARGMAARAIAIAEAGGGSGILSQAVLFDGASGAADVSSAWNAWVNTLHSTGKSGVLAPGTYTIPNATAKSLTSHVTIIALVPGTVTLVGSETSPPVLFRPRSAGLTFDGVTTKWLSLVNSIGDGAAGKLPGNIERIEIRRWKHIGGTLESPFALRSYYDTAGDPYINNLVFEDIEGVGGLCGIDCRMAFKNAYVNGVLWRDIVVPDTDAGFDGTGKMIRMGMNGGFILGEESTGLGPALTERAVIGNVLVKGVNDQRVKRAGDTANCDAIRVISNNVAFGPLYARDVTSTYKTDTTGIYLKAGYSTFSGALIAIDCGFHEAAISLKGNTYAQGASDVIAGPLFFPVIAVKNTRGFVGNPALALYGDDVHIGTLYAEGVGGDVENPQSPGNRISGVRGIVSCASPDRPKERLVIGRAIIRNCVVGNATGQDAAVFALGGYRQVDIGSAGGIYIDGLSNAGYFTGQTAGGERPINLFRIDVSTGPMAHVRIVGLNTKNISAAGKAVCVANIIGSASFALDHLEYRDFGPLTGVTQLLTSAAGDLPIGLWEMKDGDASGTGLTTNIFNTAGAKPTQVRIINVAPWNGEYDLIQDGATPTLGSGWSWSGGVLSRTAVGSATNADFPVTVKPGVTYQLDFTVDSISGTSPTVTASFEGGTSVAATAVSSVTRRIHHFTANAGTTTLRFAGNNTVACSISGIKLTELR